MVWGRDANIFYSNRTETVSSEKVNENTSEFNVDYVAFSFRLHKMLVITDDSMDEIKRSLEIMRRHRKIKKNA